MSSPLTYASPVSPQQVGPLPTFLPWRPAPTVAPPQELRCHVSRGSSEDKGALKGPWEASVAASECLLSRCQQPKAFSQG